MGNAFLGKGYNYQDFLSASFIIENLIIGVDFTAWFDKNIDNDIFDDLKLISEKSRYHFQIKYSDVMADIDFSEFSENGKLPIKKIADSIIRNHEIDRENIYFILLHRELKLVEYIEPSENNYDILNPLSRSKLFRFKTNTLRTALPHLNEDEVSMIANNLVLVSDLPDFSQKTKEPGELEDILLNQSIRLGIGVFPNENKRPDQFLDSLITMVISYRNDTRTVESSKTCTVHDILKYTQVVVNFGSLLQSKIINDNIFVSRKKEVEQLIKIISTHNKMVFIGSPGVGKSYLVENLIDTLVAQDKKIIKYFCYYGYDEPISNLRLRNENLIGTLIEGLKNIDYDLIQYKKSKYGSSIEDINLMLSHCSDDVYIFIDGVDHAYRSYRFNENALILSDYDLIETLKKIICPQNVKLVIISQDIANIDTLYNFGFYKQVIPGLCYDDAKKIFERNRIVFNGVEIDTKLLETMYEHSRGNALIFTYSSRHVILNNITTIEKFNELPGFEDDINIYYSSMVKTDSIIDILAYLAISEAPLTNEELSNISGKKLYKQFVEIKPFLIENVLSGGYYFYHESFKRFILENALENEVDFKKYRNDIIIYLTEKDHFKNEKSYLFLFRLLYLNELYQLLLNYYNEDYIYDSKRFGYSNANIYQNLQYIKKSSLILSKFNIFAQTLELIKIVSFDFGYDIIEKHPHKFSIIAQSVHNINITGRIEELKYNNINTYYTIIKSLNNTIPYNSSNIFTDHFDSLDDVNKILLLLDLNIMNESYKLDWLLSDKNLIQVILLLKKKYSHKGILQFIKNQNDQNMHHLTLIYFSLFYKTMKSTSISSNVDLFKHQNYSFALIDYMLCDDNDLTKESANRLRNGTSFYFYEQFLKFSKEWRKTDKSSIDDNKLFELYDLFSNVDNPGYGEPRSIDIFDNIGIYIYLLLEPLKYCKSGENIKTLFNSIVKLSSSLYATVRGVELNPISFNKILEWVPVIFDIETQKHIIDIIEGEIYKNLPFIIYEEAAENLLNLSYMSYLCKYDKYITHFNDAINYSFAYGYHKDLTLSDVLVTYKSYYTYKQALPLIKNLHNMAFSLQNGTDRDETNYYPIEWVLQLYEVNCYSVFEYLNHRYKRVSEKSYTKLMHKTLFEKGYFDKLHYKHYIKIVDTDCCRESSDFNRKIIDKISITKSRKVNRNLIKLFNLKFKDLSDIITENEITLIETLKRNGVSIDKIKLKKLDNGQKNKYEYLEFSNEKQVKEYFSNLLWASDGLHPDNINQILSNFDENQKIQFLIMYFIFQRDGWGRGFYLKDKLLEAYNINNEKLLEKHS